MTAIGGVSNSSSAWAAMAAQRATQQANAFGKVDANGSGSVDGTELQTLLSDVATKTGTTAANAKDVLGTYDADGNGSLDADELGTAMQGVLPPPTTLDFAQAHGGGTPGGTDGGGGSHAHGGGGAGGKVAGASGSSDGDTTYDPLDTDKDGVVSAAELAAAGVSATDAAGGSDPLAALFSAVDGNGNGKVDPGESDVLVQKIESALSAMPSTESTATGASTPAGTDGGGQDPSSPFDLQHLAQMVLQQYEQVANNGSQATAPALSAVA